jgi:hypothetical protein
MFVDQDIRSPYVDFASSVAELLFALINEYVTVKFQDFTLVRSSTCSTGILSGVNWCLVNDVV